jgi:hypothetical protein
VRDADDGHGRRRRSSSGRQLLLAADAEDTIPYCYDQRRALEFLNFVDDLPALAIEAFDLNALKHSKKLLKKFNDQALTLADAHGLVVMAGRRIGACWSTDRHMGLTGVTLMT